MKRNEVFSAFAQKLRISKAKLGTYYLNDGRILPSYVQSIFTEIKKRLQSNPANHDMVDEFSAKSAHPWDYLKKDCSLLTLARMLTLHTGRTSAKVRAECTHARIPEELLWSFLAIQMETEVDKLSPQMMVRDIKLPVAGYESHSWLTFVIWGDQIFGDGTLAEKENEVAQMSVKELFAHWTRP